MPDVYARISEADRATQERLAEVLELRTADPRHEAVWRAYLGAIAFPPAAQVLEIGCGTGAVSRMLARRPGVDRVIGIDPSAVFVERARALAGDIGNLAFEQGDGRALPFADEGFDVVVVHQTLSHVPQPERLVAEAHRVLRPGGTLAVFDGDYATATVAVGERDPLELCVEAFRAGFVHDPWIVRRLPQLLQAQGFAVASPASHGYIEAPEGSYMLTWIDRGAEALLSSGRISADQAAAFKADARQRSSARAWFGFIAFASLLGHKPRASVLRDATPSSLSPM
jgi:ubiquinone/menaquinone biosynthesis C-methylase UbiE